MTTELQTFSEDTKLFLHPASEEDHVLYQDFLNDAVRQLLEAQDAGQPVEPQIDYLRRSYNKLKEN